RARARAGQGQGRPGRVAAPVRRGRAVPRPGQRILPDDVVIAVVVTKDRPGTLADSLDAVCRQTRRVDRVVVVDNGADPKVAEIVDKLDIPTTYLPSRRNLGAARGF